MTLREEIIKEVNRLPDEQLSDAYNAIIQLKSKRKFDGTRVDIMKCAGAWSDWSDEFFNDFLEEIYSRRRRNKLS